MKSLWAALVSLPARIIIVAVWAYQVVLSPVLGRHCRFTPTCSQYFILAVRRYGAVRGAARGLLRIGRCNPFSPGGDDPP